MIFPCSRWNEKNSLRFWVAKNVDMCFIQTQKNRKNNVGELKRVVTGYARVIPSVASRDCCRNWEKKVFREKKVWLQNFFSIEYFFSQTFNWNQFSLNSKRKSIWMQIFLRNLFLSQKMHLKIKYVWLEIFSHRLQIRKTTAYLRRFKYVLALPR